MTSHVVASALEAARTALGTFVEAEMRRLYGDAWERVVRSSVPTAPAERDLDLSALLGAMLNNWGTFRNRLSPMDRALIGELRETRNLWAHQEAFSDEDTRRALDTTSRLLRSIGATAEVDLVEILSRQMGNDRTAARVLPKPPPCTDGHKRRWSMPPARQLAPTIASGSSGFTLDDIVRCLNDQQVRATYGAVAQVAGGLAQSIGARLGGAAGRRPEASWVVNAATGLPTGYQRSEMHPALNHRAEVLHTGEQLRRRLQRWKTEQ
jgi:hypothetical protein